MKVEKSHHGSGLAIVPRSTSKELSRKENNDLDFRVAVQYRLLTTTPFGLQIFHILEVGFPIKSGPVLV